MNKKLKIAILIVAVATLTAVVLGFAAYWIYSNTVQKDVTEGAVTLSVSTIGKEVTLTVTGVSNGATVQFGTTDGVNPPSDGNFAFIGSATVSSGSAVLEWTAPNIGSFTFAARAYNTDIP